MGSRAVSDNLIKQRPARTPVVVIGRRRIENHREQQRTFPTTAPMPFLIRTFRTSDHPRQGWPCGCQSQKRGGRIEPKEHASVDLQARIGV